MVEPSQDTHKRTEGKRLKEGTGPSIAGDANKIGGDIKFTKNPAFIQERKQVYDELITVQKAKYECNILPSYFPPSYYLLCRVAKTTH